MNSQIWIGLGFATYNCFVIISSSISRKKTPDAFGGPIIPVLGIIFIISSFLFYPFSIIQIPIAFFVLGSEVILSLPMLKNFYREMIKEKSALIIYPTPPTPSREHDYYKDGTLVSRGGVFKYLSEKGEEWFELKYKDEPSFRFPILWKNPDIDQIEEAAIQFSQPRIRDKDCDFISIKPEHVIQIKVWLKKSK